jgi:hypothetical protein
MNTKIVQNSNITLTPILKEINKNINTNISSLINSIKTK